MQSDPSLYCPNVVGTGSYTTRTTNMYDKDFTYRIGCRGVVHRIAFAFTGF